MSRKIDFHAHILPETLPDMQQISGYSGWIKLKNLSNGKAVMEKDTGEFFRNVDDKLWSLEERLLDMKRTGVSMQVISTVPVMFSYWAEAKDTDILCHYLNDHIAETVRKYPNQFLGLGTVALQDPQLAVEEIKRCKTDLNLSGIIIGTNVNDNGLDNEDMFPVYKVAEDLNMPLFIHPWGIKNTGRAKNYMWPYIIGMPTETTTAVAEMIFGGIFERFKQLRVCFAHGAGMYPYLYGRFERCFNTYPEAMQTKNPYPPENYSNRIFADTVLHSEESLLLANKVLGEDQLVLGSDFPFLLREEVPGNIIQLSTQLTQRQKAKFLYENAARLLNLTEDQSEVSGQ